MVTTTTETTSDWDLSPHSTTWDSPSAEKFMAAPIPCLPTPPCLNSTDTKTSEEADDEGTRVGTLDMWPSPLQTPPQGNDMHPLHISQCGEHPGPG